MFLRLFLLFTLVPLADLVLLLMISKTIPLWASVAVIVGSGLLGAWLAKRQWSNVKLRIKTRLQQNEMPGELITDGMLVLLAGGLLIAPGLITDTFGMTLLIPVCRRWYKKKAVEYLKDQFQVKVFKSSSMGGAQVVDGEFVKKSDLDEPVPYSDGSSFEDPLPTIEGAVKSDGAKQ